MKRKVVNKLKDVKIRKHSIVLVPITMGVAVIGWILFLVFFGRIDPIVKATVQKNDHLYSYGLVTAPYWLYAFSAPVIYPLLAIYILNGNWKLGVIAHLAGTTLAMILGATINMSSALFHVVQNIDENVITINICIVGIVGISLAIANLYLMMAFMPTLDRLQYTKNIKAMTKHEAKPLRKTYNDDYDDDYRQTFDQSPVSKPYEDDYYEYEEPIYDNVAPPPPPPAHKKKYASHRKGSNYIHEANYTKTNPAMDHYREMQHTLEELSASSEI